ncbi:MAG: glutamine--fructose-6-phosphate transaminase (isomerizing) [Pseudomonadota bacterium]|nr:glutamine--fructose-6-phosphate transaminase (isomerizing) [Pseudomonadota bacterium]
MCGIVGAVAERNVANILLEGLKRLEYRGYDSAGLALIQNGELVKSRAQGKVAELASLVQEQQQKGQIGIAHTRWATHGVPSVANAHPHQSGSVMLVHNGIIENYQALKTQLQNDGYAFESDTDSEVVAHLIHANYRAELGLLKTVQAVVKQLKGAYALAVLHENEPETMVVAREGSPLVIGLGIGENFIGSDQLALLPVTNRFIFLEEGDVAQITRERVNVFTAEGQNVIRETITHNGKAEEAEKGPYRHFMLKEIFEQSTAIQNTLSSLIERDSMATHAFGLEAELIFERVESVQIIACGTSYHAGLVAKYWLEEIAGISCQVEVASEFRYRKHVVPANCLMVTISQSGETADTLAALRNSVNSAYLSRLAICNVPTSSLVRESQMNFITKAGSEIGVASTKAFTTQLIALFGLCLSLAKARKHLIDEAHWVEQLRHLPTAINEVLALDTQIEQLSTLFADKHHTLFLGRGLQYPIAMEGALKLKEISYIHAEAYPAGELKHGPLALVDEEMPIVTVAPNDRLIEKLKSNLQEVRARGAQLVIFADKQVGVEPELDIEVINMPHVSQYLAPIVYTVPLQLLSYHVALIKGTDVDQPRNLAKSVTVE